MVGPSSGDAASEPQSEIGSSVGRYIVLEEIGRGGMGRVLRAYDPKLQREVALKEVHRQFLGLDGARRLVAEARAMAMLSHPNVVAVYDVEHGDSDQVVLVMEYVPGQTLRAWCKQASHAWQEIVTRFVDAGRGLAAAHAVGLLHRDFKPTNVLLGQHGVKVTDFGLAKLGGNHDRGSRDGVTLETGRRSEGLTEAGMVLGTPRYMAPEQHRGEALTEAADQYALCVALWEALCGQAPFAGEHLEAAKAAGPPPWPGGPAPRPLVEALRRGLSADPAKRWPSTGALLDALRYDPATRRKRWRQAAAGVGVLGLLGAGWRTWSASRVERCTNAAAVAHLRGTWDAERRSQVHDAVVGVGASYATDVWKKTQAALDAYATDWATMHAETCEATTVRGEQSTEVMDLRMACLHRAKVDLQATTAVLSEADAQTVQKAHELTGSLRRLSRCADIEALRAEVEPPLPEEADAVETLREHLALATATMRAGHYAQARQAVDAAEAVKRELEYGPVKAEVSLASGEVLERLGHYPEAEAALREGLQQASRLRQGETLQSIASKLLFVVGYRQRWFGEGLQYADLARGLAAGDPMREAGVDNDVANVRLAAGAYDEAARLHERALAIWEKARRPDRLRVAASLNNLANVRHATGAYEEATALLQRALAIREEALGREHPDVATTLNNLAGTRHATGAYDEAARLHERALAIREKALGREHLDVATTLNNLAGVRLSTGAYDQAGTALERALAIREEALGPDHPDVATTLNNLAGARLATGAHEKAAVLLERALVIREQALGADHPDVATTLNNLALMRSATGAYDEATTLHERALAIREKVLGADHPDVAASLHNLALMRSATGAYDVAATLLERALAIRENALGLDHPDVALGLANLALVRSATGAYDEATTLAERALGIWERALGPDHSAVAYALIGMAQVALAQHRPADAMALAERAVNVREAAGVGATDLAEARLLLARALVAAKESTARAIALATQARDAYRNAGSGHRDALEQTEAFLREYAHRR